MPKVSPSQAKNFIARAFRAIADPHPGSESLTLLWKHFKSQCAYCGIGIRRARKQAHYDHLASGGGNRLSNFVLSCPDCNELKRDMDWETFLRGQSADSALLEYRRAEIVNWQKFASNYDRTADPFLLKRAEECIAIVHQAFEEQLTELRSCKLNQQSPH